MHVTSSHNSISIDPALVNPANNVSQELIDTANKINDLQGLIPDLISDPSTDDLFSDLLGAFDLLDITTSDLLENDKSFIESGQEEDLIDIEKQKNTIEVQTNTAEIQEVINPEIQASKKKEQANAAETKKDTAEVKVNTNKVEEKTIETEKNILEISLVKAKLSNHLIIKDGKLKQTSNIDKVEKYALQQKTVILDHEKKIAYCMKNSGLRNGQSIVIDGKKYACKILSEEDYKRLMEESLVSIKGKETKPEKEEAPHTQEKHPHDLDSSFGPQESIAETSVKKTYEETRKEIVNRMLEAQRDEIEKNKEANEKKHLQNDILNEEEMKKLIKKRRLNSDRLNSEMLNHDILSGDIQKAGNKSPRQVKTIAKESHQLSQDVLGEKTIISTNNFDLVINHSFKVLPKNHRKAS